MKSSGLLLSVATASLVLAGGWYFSGYDTVKATMPEAAGPDSAAARCLFVPHQTLAFHMTSTVSAHGETDRFSAVMNWEVDEVTAEHTRVRAAFSNVAFSQELTLAQERATSPEGLPFVLEIQPDCSIAQLGFSAAWQPATRMLVSTLLDNFTFRLPLSQSHQWHSEEADGLGKYSAAFALEATDPVMIRRHKNNHQARGETAAFGLDVKLLQADAVGIFTPASPGWWHSVNGQEEMAFLMPGQDPIHMVQHFTLQRDNSRFTAVAALNWNDADFSNPYNVAVKLLPTDTLAGQFQNYDEAHQAFATAINEQPPRYYDAALAMAAWLKQHPQDVQILVAELLADLPANMRPTAFFALQLSGTGEARTALSELINNDTLSITDQARAASALADIGKPERETVDLLLNRAETADTAGSVSLLGVGSMMSRISDGELKEHVISSLQQRNAAAGSLSDELLVLDAMGNSGAAEFMPVLTEKLTSDSTSVRRHAALALAKIPGGEAGKILLQQLSTEEDAKVTSTLFKALKTAGTDMSDVLPALDNRLTSAADTQRAAIVELLGSQDTDDARQLLAAQFKRETNARIQQRIGRYVPADMLR